VAAPPITVMNSRRLMNLPKLAERQPITSDCSLVRYSNIGRSMSALGHKRTRLHVRVMSALPPKADIRAAVN
jgi:hypothetical protein